MSEWKEIKASEYCLTVTDGTHDSPKPQNEGKPLVTSKHIKNNTLDLTDAYLITQEDYDKIVKRSYVSQWDVIISMIGAYCGFCYLQSSSFTDYAVKNVGLFKVGDEIKSKWLYYYLNSPKGKEQLFKARRGSSQPYLSLNSLRGLIIPTPSFLEQKRIVSILTSLDEKIETNRQINARLEELAQALFKSWFIDFEPFGGKMPEDWEPCALGDLSSECKDRVKNRKDVRVLSPLSSGELVLSDEYFTKQVYSKDISKYIIVKPKTFAYNPARINIGSIGINDYNFDGCVSPVYVVFKTIDGYEEFINQFIKTQLFKDEVILRAIGGVRQTLSYQDFSLIRFIKPAFDIVIRYTNTVAPLYSKMKTLNIESSSLAALRDALLHKLMSGELIPK